MSSIYDRLGFNGGDPLTQAAVTPYSQGANNQMKMVPPLIKSWQANDIASGTTTSYFTNPVASAATLIYNTAVTLENLLLAAGGTITSTVSPAISTLIAGWTASSNSTQGHANTFLYITNRQSNVTEQGEDFANVHYTPAISYGKTLSYIVNQSGGIANNSAIMGMFTSITLANTLNPLAATFANSTAIFANTITYDVSSNTSNISLEEANTLNNTLASLNNILYTYPTQDNDFFNNAQDVIEDFNKVRQFTNMGGSESYLINNFIGTPSLISKINSN